MPKDRFITYLKGTKLVPNGCKYHSVSVNDFSFETPSVTPHIQKFPKKG